MIHDFDLQYHDTARTFEAMLGQIPALPDWVALDLHFRPGPFGAEPGRFRAALFTLGFRITGHEDGTLQATIDIEDIDADRIWQEERRTTKLALRCGFVPDGWGFEVPRSAPIGGVLGELLNRRA